MISFDGPSEPTTLELQANNIEAPSAVSSHHDVPPTNSTRWGPLVISWFISLNNYSYKYHKHP